MLKLIETWRFQYPLFG